MGMSAHAILFFGVHLYGVDLDKLLELPEFASLDKETIDARIANDEPIIPGVHISCLGEGDSGWAVSSQQPREVERLDRPLDQFAGDRKLLLRIATAINTHARKPTYVGWQVQLGFY